MRIISDHILQEADYHPSPYRYKETKKDHPSLVVLHSIGLPPGNYGTDAVRQYFLGNLDPDSHPSFHSIDANKVSAHIFLRRDGSLLQFVPFNQAAWHSGESVYKGRADCNRFSIGIELEGSERDIYEDIQYTKLVKISVALIHTYPHLTMDTFVSHKDIALPPGRKTDPWNFDWKRFHSLLGDSTVDLSGVYE